MAAAIRFALDHREIVDNLWQVRMAPKPSVSRAVVAEAINDAAL